MTLFQQYLHVPNISQAADELLGLRKPQMFMLVEFLLLPALPARAY